MQPISSTYEKHERRWQIRVSDAGPPLAGITASGETMAIAFGETMAVALGETIAG